MTQAEQVTRKVAIVGSGPSGFYAAQALFKRLPDVQIDMYDRLPTPFGLVRGGVAPDHPRIKQVIEIYEKILRADHLEFIGNVQVGRDIAPHELCAAYDVVLLAYGAGEGRPLGIPGEDLQGCHFANDFVGWYNGQPDYRDHVFDLSAETAVVIGHGNVATDVVRTLARPADEWRRTDMSEHAIEALQESRVREIVVIGRRGPAQAKFTPGELKELSTLPGTSASVNPADLSLSAASGAEIDAPRNLECKKNMEIFQSLAHNPDAVPAPRHITFRFCESPARINGEAQVESLTLVKNRLEGEPFCQTAVATGTRTELRCGLVFRSVGNRGVPIEGIGFDHRIGTIPHTKGRCVDGARGQRLVRYRLDQTGTHRAHRNQSRGQRRNGGFHPRGSLRAARRKKTRFNRHHALAGEQGHSNGRLSGLASDRQRRARARTAPRQAERKIYPYRRNDRCPLCWRSSRAWRWRIGVAL